MAAPQRRENDERRRMVESVARGGAIKEAGDNLLSMKDWAKQSPDSAQAYKDWKAGKRKEQGPSLTDEELTAKYGW